jgi:type IV pilus assembly protein PilA
MFNINKSFSLVELMVVIAIIGILSAIAVPSYKTYITKAKISEGMVIINKVNKAVSEHYSVKGAFPSVDELAARLNTTYTASVLAVYSPNVNYIDVTTDGARALYYGLCYSFDIGASGRRCLYVAVKDINNILTFKCGIWNVSSPASYHISDPSYLPSGCNETNVGTFYSS